MLSVHQRPDGRWCVRINGRQNPKGRSHGHRMDAHREMVSVLRARRQLDHITDFVGDQQGWDPLSTALEELHA